MVVLGVDLQSGKMSWMLVVGNVGANDAAVIATGKVHFDGSRIAANIRSFRRGVEEVLEKHKPDAIAFKSKPEKGRMGLGPDVLKMEAVILAVSDCPTKFVASNTIKKMDVSRPSGIPAYLDDAWKAACCVIEEF